VTATGGAVALQSRRNHDALVLSFVADSVFNLEAFRFDGTTWQSLGIVSSSVFYSQSLTLDAAGNPVIAFLLGFGGSNAAELRVSAYDGTAWVSLGALDFVGSATDSLSAPQVAIAPDGKPWVSWSKGSLRVMSLARFDGTSFVDVPIVPPLPAFDGVGGLTFLNGDPVVAWFAETDAAKVVVTRFRNGTWEPPTTFGSPEALHLTLIANGNTVIIGGADFSFGQGVGIVTRVAFP